MQLLTRPQIESRLDPAKAMQAVELGFRLYSEGKAVIPPVGSMQFEKPPGDVHIKYGYLQGGAHYIVKIASGHYQNPSIGLPSSQGVLLLFDQKTGVLKSILYDEGYLTDVRTGMAGALAVKYLAPPLVECIGVVGTGTQARHQLQQLKQVTSCRKVLTYGSTKLDLPEYSITQADSIEQLAKSSSIILTTTPSSKPLVFGEWIQPGTLIIAVGTDQKGKQELDASVFAKADHVIVDSRSQCLAFGDTAHAEPSDQKRVVELGEVFTAPLAIHEKAITVVDLTGLAIQDLQIAESIL